MQYLQQSTAATTLVGPILDASGVAYTGAVIGNLNITKNGTTAAMAAAATLTHDHNGMYILVFTTGNTDTLGRIDISCNASPYAMPQKEFTVLNAATFATLVTNGTLASTTSGRTLDVTATGGAGIDWGNVENQSTSVNLSATTVNLVNTTTTVTNQLTAAAIATGVWQDSTAGDFTAASSIGKALYIANIAPGAAGGHFISGSNAGTTTVGAFTSTGTMTVNAFTCTNAFATGALSCTTLTASGAVAFQSTFAVTTSTSLGAISGSTLTLSGAVAFQSTFAVTTSTSLGALSATTITASGTTSLAAVTTSGTVTMNALTVTNAFTVSGTTTHTGAVSMAAGLSITQSSADTSALVVTGNGTGHGAYFTSGSGATGNGIHLRANSTNGNGIYGVGTGTGDGMALQGGATGRGAHFVGGATSGAGVRAEALAANYNGFEGYGLGTGDGMHMEGGATGRGAHFVGGATSGEGLRIIASAGDSIGMTAIGNGDGAGVNFVGGVTGTGATFNGGATGGNGITVTANGTSKHGILITGGTAGTSDALKLVAGSGGVGARIDTLTTSGTVTFNAFTVTNAFTVSGATTLTGAVTATNAGNDIRGVTITSLGSGVAAAIATGVWTDTVAGDFTVALSVGKSIMNGVSLGTGLTVARCTLTDTLTTYTGNTPQTGDSFARIGANGVGLTSVALADATSDAVIADAVWNAATASYGSAGSYGLLIETDLDATISSRGTSTLTQAQVTGGAYALDSASFAFNAALDFTTAQKAATLARVTLVDTVTAVTGLTASNLDAAVSSRMATYTQPTGFLATTFGATVGTSTLVASDILTTALTESYAADGATFTLSQGLYMVWSLLAERSIASTTLTAKKLDGSTNSMTFTLDSATTPTSQTRAT